MTDYTSTVRQLLDTLSGTTVGARATFASTGGNCMAVVIEGDGWEVLATDAEGPLTVRDLDSDEDRYGWCVGRSYVDDTGDWVTEEPPLYLSDDLSRVQSVAWVMLANAGKPGPDARAAGLHITEAEGD